MPINTVRDPYKLSLAGLQGIFQNPLAPPAQARSTDLMTSSIPQNNRSVDALKSLADASAPDALLPDSELYRLANRDAGTVAPGANQYWGDILKQRQTDEDTQTAIENARQAAISGATTSAQLGGMNTPQAAAGYARQQAEKEAAAKQGLEAAQAGLAGSQGRLTEATADEYRQRGQGALLTGQANLYRAQHPAPVAGIGAAGSKTLAQLEAALQNELSSTSPPYMDQLHQFFNEPIQTARIASLREQIAQKRAELNIRPDASQPGATTAAGPDPTMVPEGEIYEDPATGSVWTKVNGTLHQLAGGQ
jgi:hypothetical protein